MSEAFIGEIRIFAGNFAPVDWMFCNGQLLPISQYSTLFAILGTAYGGDGKSNFALPKLNQTVPIGTGMGPGLTPRVIGEIAGSQTVTLQASEMAAHAHSPMGYSQNGATNDPTNAVWGQSSKPSHSGPVAVDLYAATPNAQMLPTALGVAGGNQPHNNMQPFLAMNFIICMNGIFPTRS